MLITPSFLSQVMLERRLSIAQLVLLLGLFVFMALTRGSSAASIARISNRRRSTYIGHGRLDRMGSIYSARGMSPSASTDQFYSHLQQGNRPSVSFEQQIAPEDQEPDTTRPKPASKGRGASSHNRSSSGLGLASENRPVRLPRSSRPPSFSRSKGNSRSSHSTRASRISMQDESNLSIPEPSSSSSASFSKSQREALKRSLRVNVLNNHANSAPPSQSAQIAPSSAPMEDFSEMSPKALRAHLGFLSPRSNSPSSIYSAHPPESATEIRTYLSTPPTPRSTSPISLRNIKAKFGGSNQGGSSSKTSFLNEILRHPASPRDVNGMLANDQGRSQSQEADQNPDNSDNFRCDESVSSWTDRSETSEDGDGDSDAPTSSSHHHFDEQESEVRDNSGAQGERNEADSLNPSTLLAPALTISSPKPEEDLIHREDQPQLPADDLDLSPPSNTNHTSQATPTSSTFDSEMNGPSEWQEVRPRRSSTYRRQGSNGTAGKRLSTPDSSRGTPPPFNKIPARSSSTSTIIPPASPSPSTPHNQNRFLPSQQSTPQNSHSAVDTFTNSRPHSPLASTSRLKHR